MVLMLAIRLLKQGTPRLGIAPRNLLQGEGKDFKKPDTSQSGNSSPRKRFPKMLTTCQPTSLERSSDNDGQDNLTDFITMHKPHNRNSRQIWGKGHWISVIFLMLATLNESPFLCFELDGEDTGLSLAWEGC